MTLPSRESFLKSGLVLATSPNAGDTFTVCTEAPTLPSTLPCKHTFCKTCIETWLTQRSRNTCPTCRHVLFALDETDRPPVRSERMVLMTAAMTHAGLLGGSYLRLSDEININISDLYRAAAQANLWLSEEFHPAATGPAVFNRQRLGVQVVAMGNLLLGYARARGSAYSEEQIRQWRVLMKALYQIIQRYDGRCMDAMIVPRVLREELRKNVAQGGLLDESFFEGNVRPDSVAADLDLLLLYLAKKAAEAFEARENARREARREPTVMEKVGHWFRRL